MDSNKTEKHEENGISNQKHLVLCFVNDNNFSSKFRDVIDTLIINYRDNVKFEIIDSDRQKELFDSFEIKYAPTLVILGPDRKETGRITGYYSMRELQTVLKRRALLQF